MIEIKLFPQDDGSVIFEAKRYDDDGEAASFTVHTDKSQLSLNRITTVKEKHMTLDTIEQIQKFAANLLK